MDVPKEAVSAILDEQSTWEYCQQRRNKSTYYHYRSLFKSKKRKRHCEEKDHIIQLRAVGSSTAEYVGSSSGTAESAALDDDITPDDDNEPNDLDRGGNDIKDLLEEDEEDDIADKLPLMFFFDLELTGGSTYIQ